MARHSSDSQDADKGLGKGAAPGDNGETAKSANRRKVSSRQVVQKTSGGNGVGDSRPVSTEKPPVPKTHLSDEELSVFREMLLIARREIVGNVDTMQDEALGKNRADAAGDLSLMPIHMADIGTDNYEREFTLGLIESETETLKEIDAALKRIEEKTYGVCEATHKPITKSRLKARPWARFTIAHKRSLEEKRR